MLDPDKPLSPEEIGASRPSEPTGYRKDIDGLRSLAVLSVVIFHASPHQVRGGFVGVDVFFVISGFLIGGIVLSALDRGNFSFLEFYARRVRRIFPALIVVLAAVWGISMFFLLPDEMRQLGKHIVGGALFSANFLYWQEAEFYFDGQSELKPLLHLWSLGVEEQFYIAFPFIAYLACKLRGPTILVMFSVLAVISFVVNIAWASSYPAFTFYLPFSRAWELLLGCGIADLARRKMLPDLSFSIAGGTVALIGTCLICAAVIFLDQSVPYPGYAALLPAVGTAMIIGAGPNAWINRTVFSNRAAVFIGLISYPLYLWHWPLLAIMRLVDGGPDEPTRIERGSAVVLSFILAVLTYQMIERRARAFSAKRIAPALSAMCVVVAALGVWTIQAGGFGWRFPGDVVDYEASQKQYFLTQQKLWRWHQCQLEGREPDSQFSPSCVDQEPPNAPLIYLWGDSHASALYPGFSALHSKQQIRVAQFAGSACGPMIPRDHSICDDINRGNIARIAKLHPELVVLSADWLHSHYDISRLPELLATLKQMGVRVLIVGPSPHWPFSLPHYMSNPRRLSNPLRLPGARSDKVVAAESALQSLAAKYVMEFFSLTDFLCDGPLCRVRFGETNAVLTHFDDAHITPEVAEKVAPLIIQQAFATNKN